MRETMIQSPLNYTGGKYRLLPQILPLFPEQIGTFVDLFCGGCNVGINVAARAHIYNDSCTPLINLYSVMQRLDSREFINRLENVIQNYGLSDVKTNGYKFYGCNSSDGLSAYNREPYMNLRQDVNHAEVQDDDYYIKLYTLIIYAFNNQIRFNRKGDFNLPPGKRDFNQNMYDKLSVFLNLLHTQKAVFTNLNFKDMDLDRLKSGDFVYVDPPYLITCAAYNEKRGWTEQDEYDLLNLLDTLSRRNIRFGLSNVIESKGRRNDILEKWVKERPDYRQIDLDYTYHNANYQRKNRKSVTREVLIVNY
ncbi:MAG: DNA adenine methylase [Eubacterium sp.]|nr:DNA adenine methylase [Eubacterium sp.]